MKRRAILTLVAVLGAASGCACWEPDAREVAALHAQIDNLGRVAEAPGPRTPDDVKRIRADVAATHSHATKATTAPVRS